MSVFPLLVSSVEGRTVPRYGSEGNYIGAARDRKDPSVIVWDTKTIVPIGADDYRSFRRPYERAIANGDLLRRTEEDFNAQREGAERIEE